MNLESHGGFDFGELRSAGIDPESLVDFSVNINPYGVSLRALEALQSFDPTRYPDRHALDLREALAHANDVTIDRILVGNGAAELIWLIAHTLMARRHDRNRRQPSANMNVPRERAPPTSSCSTPRRHTFSSMLKNCYTDRNSSARLFFCATPTTQRVFISSTHINDRYGANHLLIPTNRIAPLSRSRRLVSPLMKIQLCCAR